MNRLSYVSWVTLFNSSRYIRALQRQAGSNNFQTSKMAASLPPPYQDVVSPEEEGIFRNALPATQVELHVSCRNLADMDVFSKSDPMVVLYTQAMGSKEWREFGRTECIKDNLNPDFVKSFVISYFFEEMQKLRFAVITQLLVTNRVIYNNGSKATETLILFILLLCLPFCMKDVLTLELKGHKLDKKDFFGKSDPFLVFYRSNEDSSYTSFTACHRTEVIKNTLNPVWKPFTIPARTLCNGDYDRSIRVECYDWDRDGGHDLIGIFSTTVNELKSSPGMTFEVINPKKIKKKGYQHSGTISLVRSKLEQQPSFLDFIRGGTQINFTVAIDFTASNGDPRNVNSLHYISPHEDNQYLKALTAVGNICQDYDTDKLFPAFGFGARLPPNWQISHEFPLNGNPQDPMCSGIDGVITAYQQSIKRVQLYGPTNFAPIINQITSLRSNGNHNFFNIVKCERSSHLFALTKGFGETLIGKHGNKLKHCVVIFVPFREYLGQAGDVISGARLAKDVLEELPDQFLDFMKRHNIKPKPPPKSN
ncbi:PREDICTED: copine-9-like [Acropora digitifera]|uniref:copine-9-like n=1 Tax=Acropora digitifera TaxID=70779 RepID=UPI00077A40BC|nr:PREDICTED: copine-9-like [Acropora digitifera]